MTDEIPILYKSMIIAAAATILSWLFIDLIKSAFIGIALGIAFYIYFDLKDNHKKDIAETIDSKLRRESC